MRYSRSSGVPGALGAAHAQTVEFHSCNPTAMQPPVCRRHPSDAARRASDAAGVPACLTSHHRRSCAPSDDHAQLVAGEVLGDASRCWRPRRASAPKAPQLARASPSPRSRDPRLERPPQHHRVGCVLCLWLRIAEAQGRCRPTPRRCLSVLLTVRPSYGCTACRASGSSRPLSCRPLTRDRYGRPLSLLARTRLGTERTRQPCCSYALSFCAWVNVRMFKWLSSRVNMYGQIPRLFFTSSSMISRFTSSSMASGSNGASRKVVVQRSPVHALRDLLASW